MRRFNETFIRTLILFFFLTILVTLAGTVALYITEKWKWLDSLYMTLITITTVGFGEIHPLSEKGRIVTIFIMIGGIVTISVWVSTITRFVVEQEIGRVFRRRRMDKEIKKLKDHVILCGAGDTGRIVMKELIRSRHPFVLVERNPETIYEIKELFPDLLIVEGDATKDIILQEANIENAKAVITTLSGDTENLFVTITAKTLNKNVQMVARAVDEDTRMKLFQVGADHVVSPNVIEGLRMASVVLRPSVVSFLEVMTLGEDIDLYLEEVSISKSAKMVNKTLAEAQIPQKIGLIVIAIKKREGRFRYNPQSNTLLEAGDTLLVLGKPFQVDTLRTYLEKGKVIS